jgi:anti-anti-sigma regulatory factor
MHKVVDTGGLVVLRTEQPPGLTVRGDLGPQQVSLFSEALRTTATEQDGDVYLDCGGLQVISLEGLRAVVDAAIDLSHGDRTLIVHSLSPYFRRIFRLAQWENTPGLVLDAPAEN